ncbi:MAG: glycerate kinase [Flavobacteriaceae bacterium]|nr:glycerate kinase [Flavobacteriaceae bacterium]
MNILIAPDSFKDSLTAKEVAEAMKMGIMEFDSSANCVEISASDGGEGFLSAVQKYHPSLSTISVATQDPLGRPITAAYLYDEEAETAYIELAKASGLELLNASERNPMETSTYGTGFQIKDAIDRGAQSVYLGIGGSATNDAGLGIMKALGYGFLDGGGKEVFVKGSNLISIEKIILPNEGLGEVKFYAINDVLNPLFGVKGAAYTYGKQKGASPMEIKELDAGLRHINQVIQTQLNKFESETPGSGAAGGTGYGLKCFLHAEYISGASFILKMAKFQELVKNNKITAILTGEGCIDEQTAYGKFVHGIIQEANKFDIPVLAVCGKLNLSEDEVKKLGLYAAAQLYDPLQSREYSFINAAQLVTERTIGLLGQLKL